MDVRCRLGVRVSETERFPSEGCTKTRRLSFTRYRHRCEWMLVRKPGGAWARVE